MCFDHVATFIVNANHGVPIRLAKVARFFQNSAHMKTTTLPLRNLMNRSPVRLGFLLIPLAVACFVLAPLARAVDPPPGGGYPGGNTALGDDALFSQPDGTEAGSTAIGFQALYNNTVGGDGNTAVGNNALFSNTTGGGNTANGFWALYSNTTGERNTAIGNFALVDNTTGGSNTATGFETLEDNSTGFGNTANGFDALTFNTTGFDNTAIGSGALAFNNGNENTAIGSGALNFSTTGGNNIAVGRIAGAKVTTGSNNIDIGNQGKPGESRTIRIGTKNTQRNTFIAGISGVTVAGGVGVIVDSSGHLGTIVSSERFKDDIKPMDKASEAILALQPVTFRYKHELDPDGIPQFGLVAEQVEKVDPDLVARDADGKAYTVRYEAVNAMLLNEFLKEHRTVQQLKSTVAKQEATIAQQQKDFQATATHQQKQIEALTAGLQKVSAQVEISRPAPQTVVDNR